MRAEMQKLSSQLTKSIGPGCYRLPFVQTYKVIPYQTFSTKSNKVWLKSQVLWNWNWCIRNLYEKNQVCNEIDFFRTLLTKEAFFTFIAWKIILKKRNEKNDYFYKHNEFDCKIERQVNIQRENKVSRKNLHILYANNKLRY